MGLWHGWHRDITDREGGLLIQNGSLFLPPLDDDCVTSQSVSQNDDLACMNAGRLKDDNRVLFVVAWPKLRP